MCFPYYDWKGKEKEREGENSKIRNTDTESIKKRQVRKS